MNVVIRLIEGIGAHGGRRFLILVFQEVQLVDQLCCHKVQIKLCTRRNSDAEQWQPQGHRISCRTAHFGTQTSTKPNIPMSAPWSEPWATRPFSVFGEALCSWATPESTSLSVQQWHSVLWRATVGDGGARVRLLWRSRLERLRIVHFIFIILTVVESHGTRVRVCLKRALMCVRGTARKTGEPPCETRKHSASERVPWSTRRWLCEATAADKRCSTYSLPLTDNIHDPSAQGMSVYLCLSGCRWAVWVWSLSRQERSEEASGVTSKSKTNKLTSSSVGLNPDGPD